MNPAFLGASAAWVEEDDDVTFAHVKRTVADQLRLRLADRLAALGQVDLTADALVLEIRIQIAESAVCGDMIYAGDLSDLLMDLLAWREETRST